MERRYFLLILPSFLLMIFVLRPPIPGRVAEHPQKMEKERERERKKERKRRKEGRKEGK